MAIDREEMTTAITLDAAGLDRIGGSLDSGAAVVLPMPLPLPYVVAGRDAGAVNRAKGRPADQPCGVAVADFDRVTPFLRLDQESLAFAHWLMTDQLINLLLPVGDDPPDWMAPSISAGRFAIMLGWLPAIRRLLDDRDHLYVSSANLTGGSVAVTAAAAEQTLGADTPVLDGDRLRQPRGESGSAAILSVESDGAVQLVRSGIQTVGRDDHRIFLDELRQAWSDRPHPPQNTRG
ncbi:Sua5/YciO/YrdC/YwlC family protein [Microlunatus soli]|uniref:Sua5/YciO/YrdC/YwlC family protein n=1 Tax=Microlunatus soli TaxID=630515 RepID=UPI000B876F21|nr:Sua5/YciO/YrdC/YwlC family protein [Microlunatus soli]